jgi:AcrR family transcriptional regulator
MDDDADSRAEGVQGMPEHRPSRVERREFFLDVVSHLVEDEGLAAVTMERVAALADVSKPVLYSHFADRGALLTALLERCWRQLDAAVQAKLRTARTFDESLEALVTGYFDELDRQGRVLQLMVVSGWHESAVESARRRRHQSAELQWSAFYQERMGLPRAVADPAAAIMRSALQGAAAYRIEHPESRQRVLIDTCLAVMRAGLERLRREQRARLVGPTAAARRPRQSPARS